MLHFIFIIRVMYLYVRRGSGVCHQILVFSRCHFASFDHMTARIERAQLAWRMDFDFNRLRGQYVIGRVFALVGREFVWQRVSNYRSDRFGVRLARYLTTSRWMTR